jgi:hypothetical protein
MPGIRGEDEILKAFEGLDYVPGSKQKRRVPSENPSRRNSTESNGWDASPITKVLGGEEVEVFTISALAVALEKEIVTIRLWERKGYIPRAPYRLRSKTLKGQKTGGNRVYTRALIEATLEEFSKRGLLGVARIEWGQHEDLTDALVLRWKEITETESRNAS